MLLFLRNPFLFFVVFIFEELGLLWRVVPEIRFLDQRSQSPVVLQEGNAVLARLGDQLTDQSGSVAYQFGKVSRGRKSANLRISLEDADDGAVRFTHMPEEQIEAMTQSVDDPRQQRILEQIMRAIGTGVLSTAQITDSKNLGIEGAPNTRKSLLRRMEADGMIVAVPGRRGAKIWRCA